MKKILLFCGFLVLLTSCQTSNVAVDYDNAYNFTPIKTYNYYVDNTIQLNKLDSTNFIRSMDIALQSKGLRKVKDADNPDVFISVQVYNKEGINTNMVNLGIGGGSGWFGMGTSIGIPIKNKTQEYSIQVDFDDAKTRTLVWTGKIANSLSYNASSEAKSSFYKSNIQSLLKKYPPKAQSNKKSNYYN